MVSHNNKSFVGASIAVSNFLRPLYLLKRIADFKKPRLREAIIFHQPLNTEDTQDWTSEARNIMSTYKPACTNCRRTFERLNGFVPETEPVDGKNRTFLGACAEFCPVDKLLYDETNASDVQETGNRLQRNLERCLTYTLRNLMQLVNSAKMLRILKTSKKNKRGIHPNTSYSSHFWSNTRL